MYWTRGRLLSGSEFHDVRVSNRCVLDLRNFSVTDGNVSSGASGMKFEQIPRPDQTSRDSSHSPKTARGQLCAQSGNLHVATDRHKTDVQNRLTWWDPTRLLIYPNILFEMALDKHYARHHSK